MTGRARAHAGGEHQRVVGACRLHEGGAAERARQPLSNGAARFELWSAIVTPNKVAQAVRKVLARFPGKAAPTGITRKIRRKGRRK